MTYILSAMRAEDGDRRFAGDGVIARIDAGGEGALRGSGLLRGQWWPTRTASWQGLEWRQDA